MTLVLLTLLALTPPTESSVRVDRLDNGLRVVVVEDRRMPLASVQLWYRVGSAHDALDRPGLCHIARTLWEHRHDAAIRLRAAGVRFESRTLRDACYFASLLPSPSLDDTLRIEAQRMSPLVADDPGVHAALEIAAQDYGVQPDDPLARTERELLAAAFPEHPYQHPPGLVADVWRGVTAADVNEFLRQWFVPGNATLIVIGPRPAAELTSRVRELFGSLPSVEPPHRARPPLLSTQPASVASPSGGRAGFELAWVTPAGVFDNLPFDVLMHRLCNPIDGPLYRRVTEAGWAPPVWRHEVWRDAGWLVLTVDSSGPVSRFEKMVTEELENALRSLPAEIELDRARTLAVQGVLHRRASLADRCLQMALHQVIHGELAGVDWLVPTLQRMPVGDVQRAAAQLVDARRVTLHRTPVTEAPSRPTRPRPLAVTPPQRLPAADVFELLTRFGPSPPSPGIAYDALEFSACGEAGPRIHIQLVRLPGAELAAVQTMVPLAGPAIRLLPYLGTTDWTAAQVADYLSYHGITLHTVRHGSIGALLALGPCDRVLQMADLELRLLTDARLTADSVAAAQAAFAASLRPHGAAPREYADRLATHALELNPAPTDAAGVRSTLRRALGDRHWATLVVGDVDSERHCAELQALWSGRLPDPHGADEARATAQLETETQPARRRIFWVPGDSPRVELRVVIALEENVRATPFGGEFAALLVGGQLGGSAEIDGRVVWPWAARVAPPGQLTLGTCVAAADVAPALRGLIQRPLPRTEFEPIPVFAWQAWQRAVCGAWLASDSVEGLARLLWQPLEALSPGGPRDDELAGLARMAVLHQGDVLIAVGGDERVRAALAEFGPVQTLAPE